MRRLAELNRFRLPGILLIFLFTAFAVGCAGTAGPKDKEVPAGPVYAKNLKPLTPQPDQSALTSGLSVVYFRSFMFKTLDNLPSGEYAEQTGRPGKPIPALNHAFGKEEVFDSGQKTYIGMRAVGLIHFRQTGQYVLQAMSNDGIRVYLDGRRVIDDGEWQKKGDRMSHRAIVDIQTAGWYPLQVEYFQAEGTSTIKLLWQTPDHQQLVPVPPESYAHQ